MSRAFVKEDDVAGWERLPEHPLPPGPNYVTEVGLAQIDKALTNARVAFAAAQAEGRSEAAASAARDARYWAARRESAEVVSAPERPDRVQFGSTVTIRRTDGRVQTFRIVGEDEADPAQGMISPASPLARAVMGKDVGDDAALGGSRIAITAIA